jgi:hypothetical protein
MTYRKAIFERFSFLHIRPAGILRVFMPAAVALSMMTVQAAISSPLRYQPRADAMFLYKVKIVAELPDRVETSEDTISYKVKSTGEIVKLVYSGGLSKSTKHKDESSSARRYSGPLPFYRGSSTYGRLPGNTRHKENRISLTPRGGVQTLEGSSQLPYLLGNLSTFIFEPLPEKDQKSWTLEASVSIFEKKSSSSRKFSIQPRHRRMPRSMHRRTPLPLHDNNNLDKTTAGSESTSFVFQSDKDGLATFQKTYRLRSGEDKEGVTITGSGVWVFNRRLNMPGSLDCKYNIVFKKDNLTLNVPVTVKYHHVSDEELAKIKKKREELRKKFKAERERRLAEQKAPIEGKERQQILAGLKSDDASDLYLVLNKLAQKKTRDEKEIAAAIEPLLKHLDSTVRNSSERAIVKFAPELARKIKINKDYAGMGCVDVTGEVVTARTPLPAGLIVAASEFGSQYRAAKIIRKLDNGQVEIRFNVSPRTKTVHWSDIRLAPPEIDQPLISKQMLAKIRSGNSADDDDKKDDGSNDGDSSTPSPATKSDRGYRTWTDDSGTFTIIAKYVKVDGDKICLLRKKDGKTIKVPLARLSKADKKVAQRLKESPQASNPFDP